MVEIHFVLERFIGREIGSKGIVLFRTALSIVSGEQVGGERFGWNNGRLGEKWGAIPVDRRQRRGKTTRIPG